MLRRQLDGKIRSWAIQWRLAMFRHDGLALYPRQTLVANKGFDGSGTHCGVSMEPQDRLSMTGARADTRFPAVDVDTAAYTQVQAYLKARHSLMARARRRLSQILART
jgi:IS5 family transposase